MNHLRGPCSDREVRRAASGPAETHIYPILATFTTIAINIPTYKINRGCSSLMVRAPRCGRGNPGSIPGYVNYFLSSRLLFVVVQCSKVHVVSVRRSCCHFFVPLVIVEGGRSLLPRVAHPSPPLQQARQVPVGVFLSIGHLFSCLQGPTIF